jgi:hypothetical protein
MYLGTGSQPQASVSCQAIHSAVGCAVTPIQPFVRRHCRFAICREHCRAKTPAPLSAVTVGTPFDPRIHALAIYLETRQALSNERLRQAFSDLFGLPSKLGQGPIEKDIGRRRIPADLNRSGGQNFLGILGEMGSE